MEHTITLIISIALVVGIGYAVFSSESSHDFKTNDQMLGRAQFVEFEGMKCIEYRFDRGGSLDCDWSSKK